MFDSMFGSINSLERGLNASWKTNEVISSNIANIDTPGYKRKTVSFGDLLSDETNKQNFGVTHSRHIPIKSSKGNLININTDGSTEALREDGNNVDIDTEMSELSKNLLYYNVLSQKVSGEFSKLRSAITGGN